jgi:sorting nexin-29
MDPGKDSIQLFNWNYSGIAHKGDIMYCSNYRGLTLLNTSYKILSRLLYKRLEQAVNEICGECQAGFWKNRAVTDHLFSLRQIVEKCGEYNIDVHMQFIDFKKAYDSNKQDKIWEALQDLGLSLRLFVCYI